MSGTTNSTPARRRRLLASLSSSAEGGPARAFALLASLVLLGSFLRVLVGVTDVVGGTRWLLVFGLGAFLLATILALVLPDGIDLPVGIAVGAGFLVAGLGGYLLLIPDVYYALFSLYRVYVDTAALLAGQSVLLLLDADLWVLGIAPGPVFLTWFFAIRRRYEAAAIVGGSTLGFFTLTGDASAIGTVVGMTAALGVLGFGSIDRWDGTLDQLQDVGLILVAAILATRFIDLVPDGGSSIGEVLGQESTLEGTLVGSPDQVPVVGSITLSPAVRFTVRADTATYWRVASFDRYTGEGWVSTADVQAYSGTLSGPPGDSREIVQEYEFQATSQAMPAAWKPVFVEEPRANDTLVSDAGGVQPAGTFQEGDRYRVVSREPDWSAADLRESDRVYPGRIREQYLQLPDSTSDRLEERAREIASDVDSPYAATTNISDWLQSEKSYSLDVQRAGSDVADDFVFDMDSGYCVYFATALTVMLRTIGIPARFVVGYSTGERLGENRFRVRGLHSHAWTEVFFPETGWITVDPTPSEPRRAAREQRIDGGDDTGSGTGDGPEQTETQTPTAAEPTPDPDADPENGTGRTPMETMPDHIREEFGGNQPSDPGTRPELSPTGRGHTAADAGTNGPGDGTAESVPVPRDDAGARLTVLAGAAGLVLGAYRLGALERLHRTTVLRSQDPSDDPETDVERAFERLEYLLEREHRKRRRDETPRAYVTSLDEERRGGLDDRIHRVLALYEQVRYSDDPRPEDAREAIRLVDELIDER